MKRVERKKEKKGAHGDWPVSPKINKVWAAP